MLSVSRRFVATGLLALTVASTAFATASQAEAHNNFGRGLAAGLAGAVIGGALLAGAGHAPASIAPPYAPLPYGSPAYAYGRGPAVSYDARCHIVWRQNAWGDMYRTRVCN
jgi:hypothetical protein